MRAFLPAVLASLIFAACAAPAPVVVEEPPPPVETGPAFEATLVQDGKVNGLETASGQLAAVFPGGAYGAVLFALAADDSTRLLRADQWGVEQVHAVQGEAVYTAVWSDDGSLASFGHYRPRGDASPGRPSMGDGDVLLLDGTLVSRVGCSASRAVLAWAPNNRLLVRNTNNLYLVSRDGCDTIATVDARRMHGVTPSPDGAKLAFVHRELEYNRSTRAYEADSTFRLTDLDGSNEKTIVSFRYRPKRLSWKADGTELAFDVAASPDAGRAISIFDVASGTTAFLHPPAADLDEFAPVWSPGGDRIAYLRGAEGGPWSVWVRSFASTFPEGIPDSDGASVEGWAGPDAVVYRTPDGTVRVYDFSTRSVTELGTADGVVRVARAEG